MLSHNSTAVAWSVQDTWVRAESTKQRLQFPWEVEITKYFPATASADSTEIPGLSLKLEIAEQKPDLPSPAFLARIASYHHGDLPTHPFAVIQSRAIGELSDEQRLGIQINRNELCMFSIWQGVKFKLLYPRMFFYTD